jgi:hypothetical protein
VEKEIKGSAAPLFPKNLFVHLFLKSTDLFQHLNYATSDRETTIRNSGMHFFIFFK